jgi:hypothetical protein
MHFADLWHFAQFGHFGALRGLLAFCGTLRSFGNSRTLDILTHFAIFGQLRGVLCISRSSGILGHFADFAHFGALRDLLAILWVWGTSRSLSIL